MHEERGQSHLGFHIFADAILVGQPDGHLHQHSIPPSITAAPRLTSTITINTSTSHVGGDSRADCIGVVAVPTTWMAPAASPAWAMTMYLAAWVTIEQIAWAATTEPAEPVAWAAAPP
jgi:hypothetical protein